MRTSFLNIGGMPAPNPILYRYSKSVTGTPDEPETFTSLTFAVVGLELSIRSSMIFAYDSFS